MVKLKIVTILDFVNQKILGIHKITIRDLTQFNLILAQLTLGSKIENKLNSKFLIFFCKKSKN